MRWCLSELVGCIDLFLRYRLMFYLGGSGNRCRCVLVLWLVLVFSRVIVVLV